MYREMYYPELSQNRLHLVYSSADEVYLLRGTALCSSNLKTPDFKKCRGSQEHYLRIISFY